ncbi:MAG TPA: GspH/FimT family pseudopilin [Gemmatimonadales bacterium]
MISAAGRLAGFTLVEIVVVLAILTIGAAAVAPALGRAAREDGPPAAAEEVARLLRVARSRALDGGGTVTVLLNPGTRRYLVVAGTGAGEDSTLAEGALPLAGAAELTAASPRSRFEFDRFGAAVSDTILVRGGGDAVKVWVERWSGEVRISRMGMGG